MVTGGGRKRPRATGTAGPTAAETRQLPSAPVQVAPVDMRSEGWEIPLDPRVTFSLLEDPPLKPFAIGGRAASLAASPNSFLRSPRARRTRRPTATPTSSLVAAILLGFLGFSSTLRVSAAATDGTSAIGSGQPSNNGHHNLNQRGSGRTSRQSRSARLCSPHEDARAYVTTLASDSSFGKGGGSGRRSSRKRGGPDGDVTSALAPRVLAQSLRSAGAKGEVVVLVPLDQATGMNVDALRRDGLTVHIVPRGLQSAGGEIVSEELMTKVFLWSLTSYDRVVYLDPRSLIQKNPDALFACEGFCAAGAVRSPFPALDADPFAMAAQAAQAAAAGGGDEPADEATASVAAAAQAADLHSAFEQPLWQPSTSVMVLEPSIDVHVAMLDELTKTTNVGSLEAQVFLSSFLGAEGERCTQFDDLAAAAAAAAAGGHSERRSRPALAGNRGKGNKVRGGGWTEEENMPRSDDGGVALGSGDALEDAFAPVVLLNEAHMPRCAQERERTPAGVCQKLPYTYATPSSDLQAKETWGGEPKPATEAHIIHFADEDAPWKRMAYLHKPLFWKWNSYREQLDYPYGSFYSPWILFFVPCVVLAFARVYYKSAGYGESEGTGAEGKGGVNGRVVPIGDDGGAASTAAVAASGGRASKENSPSRRRWFRGRKQQQQQPQRQVTAILPVCGMASAYDGGAVGGSLERGPSYRSSITGTAHSAAAPKPAPATPAAAEIDEASNNASPLPLGMFWLLSALVSAFGLLWFRGSQALALAVVDASWHPVISVAVYDAWLCCALMIGLYVLDYLHYVRMTRGRTVIKDAVVLFLVINVITFLHKPTRGRNRTWAAATGAAVIALGVAHGSRAGSAYHLSRRVHFRCMAASSLLRTLSSVTLCYGGIVAHPLVASRHAHVAAAAAQMLFTALVYASVVAGVRVRAGCPADADDASAKLPRSCSSASFVGDALLLPGHVAESRVATAAVAAAEAVRPVASLRASWSLLKRAAAWTSKLLRERILLAICAIVLICWTLRGKPLPMAHVRRLEKNGWSCLANPAGFVQAGSKRLAKTCSAEQALKPVVTGIYFEAFRQDKICLELGGNGGGEGFLTLGRVHVAQACTPENQFVFQRVKSPNAKVKPGSSDAMSAAPSAASADIGEYCVYNPVSGFYLSAEARPQARCGPHERWRLKRVSGAPSLKRNSRQGGARVKASKAITMLLHPDYLSHGPLHTLYGYLLAATVLLTARAIFAKLADARGSASGARAGVNGARGHGSSRQRYGGLHSRQRSRGRQHSRARNSGGRGIETAYFADAGYAGDAEAGGSGYGSSGGRARSLNAPFGAEDDARSLSESPCTMDQRAYVGWNIDVMTAGRNEDDDSQQPGRWPAPIDRSYSKEKVMKASSLPGATATTSAFRGGDLATKLLRVLCLLCDATLLAGLWCLIPAHFAQALSALTHDHHSAITQGLGMGEEDLANADEFSARSLGEASKLGGEGGGGLGAGEAGAGAADLHGASCEGGAWWITAVLMRWHLVLLVLAFCHLHAAVAAGAASGRIRGRRTGKKTAERSSLWGLRAGERLAMRIRTALVFLTLLCVVVTATAGPGLSDHIGMIFLGLHAHPSWSSCADVVGLDGSWDIVSPLLVFAVLAAAGGVYARAGASAAVRLGASGFMLVAALVIGAAGGRAYLFLAAVAAAMDWASWAIAGTLSCMCYRDVEDRPPFLRESSGSAASIEDGGAVPAPGENRRLGGVRAAAAGTGAAGTTPGPVGGARQRNGNEARRVNR